MLLCGALRVTINGNRAGRAEEKEKDMGRTATILAVATLMVVLSAGAALAAAPVLTGTDGDDQLKGTKKGEEIRGLGGEDEIVDGLGKDSVYGGDGADNLIGYGGDTSTDRFRGGADDDTTQSRDVPASKDRVACGPGVDRVYADEADVVSGDCEKVKAW
jgi:Ca2+-binding RTX toxin-like protein